MGGEVRYAGFWIRFVAFFIDSLIVMLIVGPLLWKVYGSAYFQDYVDLLQGRIDLAADRPMFAGPADFFISLVLPAIGIVILWVARSATPGKMMLSLKIVDANTLGPLSAMQSIARYLGYYVSMFGMMLGFLWIAFDPRKQAWHDKIGRTVVIHARR
jgi:uncharacterized RDD family membrane protein YckC